MGGDKPLLRAGPEDEEALKGFDLPSSDVSGGRSCMAARTSVRWRQRPRWAAGEPLVWRFTSEPLRSRIWVVSSLGLTPALRCFESRTSVSHSSEGLRGDRKCQEIVVDWW